MGFLAIVNEALSLLLQDFSTLTILGISLTTFAIIAILINILTQIFFKNPLEPPLVFHWVPFIGNTITYGIEPYKFFHDCQAKYGDVFTFILLGKKTTVYLGTKGNEFILNGKLKDLNAEEIYSPLTTPVFGTGVIFDCPNSKLMEQKKFIKYGLTTESLRSYVPLITDEVENFFKHHSSMQGQTGRVSITSILAEITIYTASRTLQGQEIREKFDSSFADLYHDLDGGFTPINFMLPWAPLPQNRKRDAAQIRLTRIYTDIIESRRKSGLEETKDMIGNLMSSVYKDGTPVSDSDVAHMLIALLMAGQHTSSSVGSWIMLRLASQPAVMQELYREQTRILGADMRALTWDDLQNMSLHMAVVKETLRLHAPIHSILRKVKSPMAIAGTPFVIPPSRILLAAPGVASQDSTYFLEPMEWNPSRWMSDAGAKQEPEDMEDYGYGLISKGASSPFLPFGAGRHRCIGEQFAYLQLMTITAAMVKGFRFMAPGCEHAIVETDYTSLLSRPKAPATIEWERRIKAA